MGGSSKKVTVGYRYFLGLHLILCHGPIDKLIRIRVDERDAWLGSRRAGRISINKESLFGGESREGGISGQLDFETGEPTQGVNDYLASRLGSLVPAFRGVVGIVLRQMYVGMNPYLKKWDFRVSRVMLRQDGIPQWYPTTASIPTVESFTVRQRILFSIDDSGSMNESVGGGRTRLDVLKDNLVNVLDELKLLKTDASVPLDIAIHRFNGGSTQYVDISLAGLDTLKTWVVNMTASGGTDFTGSFTYAKSWFSATAEERRNVMVLITDGEPSPTSTFPASLAEAAPILQQTGIWSGNNAVDVHAVNIDLGNTFYSEQLDNTAGDGVPVVDGSSSDELYNAVFFAFMGNSPAMNIVHAIRECLTDPTWGMGYAESDVDDVSFRAAALKLRQERLGICLLWDRQKTIQDMVQELLKHANASLYVDRKTGLFRIKLIRDDYVAGDLLHLTEANIQKVDNFKRRAFGELTTSVTVNYWNVTTGRNALAFTEDIALAAMQQASVNSTMQYPGLPDPIMAQRVAQRDLKALSSQMATCDVYADRTARVLNPGDAVRISWSDYALDETVFRVQDVAYGDGKSNRVKLTLTEDVFGMPNVAYTTPAPPIWEDPQQPPLPATRQTAFEVPYLELVQRQGQTIIDALLADNPDLGYIGAAVATPGGSAINARMYLNDGSSGYEDSGLVDFCPAATLPLDVDYLDDVIDVAATSALGQATPGTWAQINDELVAVVDVNGSQITLKRGVLDTVPAQHPAGSHLLWWDEFATADDTEYVSSESIDVKVTPVSGSGEVALDDAETMTVEVRGRAARPYPPAQVRINGLYYPDAQSGDLVLTWVHRNRTQQTGGELLGFIDDGVTPEAGTTYRVEARGPTGTLLHSEDAISGTTATVPAASLVENPVTLMVYSVRDGLDCYQPFVHDVSGLVPPANLTVTQV